MSCYRVLHEAIADDVLSDWRKYCLARGMTFGGYPEASAHTITVVSDSRRMSVTIGCPGSATPEETLAAFLADYTRRNPHLTLDEYPGEEELLAHAKYEGYVGFIVP